MKLAGKVAIITGGANGIGKATAELFIKQGANVVIADIAEHGGLVVEELRSAGGEAIFVKTDVSSEVEIKKLIEETVHSFGKLDVMVVNAGIGNAAPTHELSLESWQKMMNINLTGVFLCDKYAIKQMLKQPTCSIY